MLHITKLVQVPSFARWNVFRYLKQPREQIVEESNQRRLAAKVQLQRLLDTTSSDQRRSHLAKHVNIRAAEAVDRLLAIADDEKICRPAAFAQCEPFEQHALYRVSVLKLVDEKEPVALRSARNHLRPLQ